VLRFYDKELGEVREHLLRVLLELLARSVNDDELLQEVLDFHVDGLFRVSVPRHLEVVLPKDQREREVHQAVVLQAFPEEALGHGHEAIPEQDHEEEEAAGIG